MPPYSSEYAMMAPTCTKSSVIFPFTIGGGTGSVAKASVVSKDNMIQSPKRVPSIIHNNPKPLGFSPDTSSLHPFSMIHQYTACPYRT